MKNARLWTGLEEFRESLPEERRHEKFSLFHFGFDIVKAQFLIQKKKLPVIRLDVREWAQGLGLAGERKDEAISIMTGVCDSNVFRDVIDYSVPIIVAQFKPRRGSEVVTWLIDGNHRLRRAFLEKAEDIPAYLLDEKLTKLIMD